MERPAVAEFTRLIDEIFGLDIDKKKQEEPSPEQQKKDQTDKPKK